MEETETWTPDLDLSLFFSNYEIKVIDTQQVADRTCLVIEQYHKHDNQLVIKYVIDKETGLTLNQYRYDPQGNLYLAFETLAIDYEPDFSAIDFDSIPDYTVSIQQHPLSQTDFSKLVPWINLTSLPLPEGFQVIGYSQVDYPKEIQQSLYLTEKYPNTPITHLWIWLSDGYYISTIEVSFATTQTVNITENSEIKIVENTTDSTTAVILEQPIAIEIIGQHSLQNNAKQFYKPKPTSIRFAV